MNDKPRLRTCLDVGHDSCASVRALAEARQRYTHRTVSAHSKRVQVAVRRALQRGNQLLHRLACRIQAADEHFVARLTLESYCGQPRTFKVSSVQGPTKLYS